MAKKSILISVTETDLTLPGHLQKPLDVSISIDGLNSLDCANLLADALKEILKQISQQVNQQNINQLKK